MSCSQTRATLVRATGTLVAVFRALGSFAAPRASGVFANGNTAMAFDPYYDSSNDRYTNGTEAYFKLA